MKLLLDVGNSRCKWGVLHDDALQHMNALEYTQNDTHVRVNECLQAINLEGIEAVHVVSVLGDEFEKMFIEKLNIPVTFYRSQKHAYAINLKYANVNTYGNDRYAALVAAHDQISGGKIVVDCGTATTIDVIDGHGDHQGGLIMPGAHLMVDSLVNKTNGITFDRATHTINLLCDNTQEAVYSGCVAQYQKGVLGIIQQLADENNYTIVLTGGESKLLDMTKINAIDCIHRPHLVLEGVQIMQG